MRVAPFFLAIFLITNLINNNFMNHELIEFLKLLITPVFSFLTALFVRSKEKQSLRKQGELKDKVYFSQNGKTDPNEKIK